MRAVLLSLFPALAAAHFRVLYPPARGFDPDKLVNYPCGGFDTPSSNRTSFPLSGGPIQLDFEHTQQNVQVVFALGNNPTGNDYTYTLVPTFYEQGPRSFCISNTAFPSTLNISAGTNGTILVITNGDPDGGLYNCADVTFTSTPLSASDFSSHCTNSSGITVSSSQRTNANGSTSGTSSGSPSGSSTGSAAKPTTSKTSAAAPAGEIAGWLIGGLGLLAGFMAL